jgi:5-carboxymethyl-2-hydroxymuconate isomerase
VLARLGPGRTPDDKRRLLDALMDAVEVALGPAAANVMLSAECSEIDPELRINRNNLRDVMAGRTPGDAHVRDLST